MEIDLCGTELFPLIWIPLKFRKLTPDISPLSKSSFSIWDSMCKAQNWPYNSPLMHIMGHDFFPPGNIDQFWKPDLSWPFATTPCDFHGGGVLPMADLFTSAPISFLDQWKYHQLSQFVHSLPQPLRSDSDLTSVETLLEGNLPTERPVLFTIWKMRH